MFFKRSKKKEEKKQAKVGDLFFYATLIFFLVIASTGIIVIPNILFDRDLNTLVFLGVGVACGIFLASILIRSYISVFIHELKHMLVALISGNRAKGMKVSKESGHFEYEYSSDTESYNAFISLAPYYVPLITAPTIIALLFLKIPHEMGIFWLGVAYGADLLLCMRDISPIQSDFSNIIGGFYPGVAYIIALHIVFISVLVVWTVAGFPGLEQFFYHIFSDIAGKNL